MSHTEHTPPLHGLRLPALLAALAVLALATLAWYQRPDGYLHVLFLDTPGDAVLIQSPPGGYVLVDGGADPVALALHLGRYLPFWQRTFDAVVLTQGDEQRLPGQVAALARYRTRLVLAPPVLPPGDTAREWARLIDEQGIAVHAAQPGERLALGGAQLTVVEAGDGATSGLVLRLDYGATSVLLNGAGGSADASTLQASGRPVTVLAYPWQRDLPPALLAAWQPQAIIFTTAQQHEPPALRTTYERAHGNLQLYRHLYHPERDGTIELVSDGRATCLRRADEPPCFNR